MYAPLKFSKRISRPMHASGIANAILQSLGGGANDADLMERWAEIVGSDIADIADLVSLSRKKKTKSAAIKSDSSGRTVTIKVKNPAMATLVAYSNDQILKSLNKYFGKDEFSKVIIRK